MKLRFLPFDESRDQITATETTRLPLSIAMIIAGIPAVFCAMAALFLPMTAAIAWLDVSIGFMSVMAGFAWMLGLKARALNTLIFCCAFAGYIWLKG